MRLGGVTCVAVEALGTPLLRLARAALPARDRDVARSATLPSMNVQDSAAGGQ
jgi:hypothetical protein